MKNLNFEFLQFTFKRDHSSTDTEMSKKSTTVTTDICSGVQDGKQLFQAVP